MTKELEEFWRAEGSQHMQECPDVVPAYEDNYFLQYLIGVPFTSFLEVGCNMGQYTKAILSRKIVDDYLGFDVCQDAVEQGRGIGLNLQTASLQSFASDKMYDLVFASGVFMHIHPLEVREMLLKYYKMSRRLFVFNDYHCFWRTGRGFRYQEAEQGIWYHDFDGIFKELGLVACRLRSSRVNRKYRFWVLYK